MTTALSFNRAVFGQPGNLPTADAAPASGKAKANVWLNVGQTVTVSKTDGTTEERFVSLPFGLGLDNMEPQELKGQNIEYNRFIEAKNDFLRQLQDMAKDLKPGEDIVISGLEIQLRRVNEPVTSAQVAESGENPFRIQLSTRSTAPAAASTEPATG
jgi:hypothetical protein